MATRSSRPATHLPVDPVAGITCIAIAAALYSVYDAAAKWLVADFAPVQIVFFRAVFALLPWLLWVMREAQPRRVAETARPGLQVLRGVLGFAAFVCFALAYRELPLAMAVAVIYSAPIFMTGLSGPLLGERVGAFRWGVVLAGFAGVLLIARPGPGMLDSGIGWALAGALLYGLSGLATRRLGAGDRATTTMLYSMGVYLVLAGGALPWAWQTPDGPAWAAFVLAGVVAGIAQFFLFQAYRHAPVATVSPFEYTILGWAIVWGALFWHELPDAVTIAGMAVVVAAGTALARHERPGR